jgi:hypothetical protein
MTVGTRKDYRGATGGKRSHAKSASKAASVTHFADSAEHKLRRFAWFLQDEPATRSRLSRATIGSKH